MNMVDQSSPELAVRRYCKGFGRVCQGAWFNHPGGGRKPKTEQMGQTGHYKALLGHVSFVGPEFLWFKMLQMLHFYDYLMCNILRC